MVNRINAQTPRINNHVERQGTFRPLAARLGFMAVTAFSALPFIACTNAPSEMCKGSSSPSNTAPLSMGAAPSSVKEADLAAGVKVKWEAASPVLNCDGSVENMQLTVHWPTGVKSYSPNAGSNRFIIEESFTSAMSSAVTGDLTYYNPNDGSLQVMKDAATLWPFAVEKKGDYATGCNDANPRIEGNITFSVEPTNLKAGDTTTVSILKSLVRSCAVDGNVTGLFRLDSVDLATAQDEKYSAELPALTAGNHVLYFFATETTVKDSAPAVIAKYFSIQEAAKTACDYDPNPKIQGDIALSQNPNAIYVGDEITLSIPQSLIVACSQNLAVTFRVENQDYPAQVDSGNYFIKHAFTTSGDKKVFLFATDPTLNNPTPPNVSTGFYVKEVATNVEAPLAGITAPSSAVSGIAVTLKAKWANDQLFSYSWSFADGSSDIGKEVSKIFVAESGNQETIKYRLVAARLDNPEVKDEAEQTITVVQPATTPLSLSAIIPDWGTVGSSIPMSIYNADETNWDYAWNYGDLTANGSGANVSHPYALAAKFTVIVSATNKTNPNLQYFLTDYIKISAQ